MSDVIISVGNRVKSRQGTRYRQWATGVLRHIVSGHTLNEQRLREMPRSPASFGPGFRLGQMAIL